MNSVGQVTRTIVSGRGNSRSGHAYFNDSPQRVTRTFVIIHRGVTRTSVIVHIGVTRTLMIVHRGVTRTSVIVHREVTRISVLVRTECTRTLTIHAHHSMFIVGVFSVFCGIGEDFVTEQRAKFDFHIGT